MKNSGFDAWMARLDYMRKDLPFGPTKRVVNEEGALHCDTAPALITPTRVTWYKNGRKHGVDADMFGSIYYYYENIRIPPKFFLTPDKITLAEVFAHENTEVRYVGMKIIGLDKLMEHPNTTIVHTDKKKGMVLFKIDGVFEEPVAYVKVINSTPEPDGTYKNYFLCVPPDMKTCQQAVAWTFRMEKAEYQPQQET